MTTPDRTPQPKDSALPDADFHSNDSLHSSRQPKNLEYFQFSQSVSVTQTVTDQAKRYDIDVLEEAKGLSFAQLEKEVMKSHGELLYVERVIDESLEEPLKLGKIAVLDLEGTHLSYDSSVLDQQGLTQDAELKSVVEEKLLSAITLLNCAKLRGESLTHAQKDFLDLLYRGVIIFAIDKPYGIKYIDSIGFKGISEEHHYIGDSIAVASLPLGQLDN